MKLFLKYRKIIFHVLGWTMFFVIQLTMFSSFRINFDVFLYLLSGILWVMYFYLNFSLLIPHLLFKKRIAFFFTSVFIISTIFYFANRQVNMSFQKKRYSEFSKERVEMYDDLKIKHKREKRPQLVSWYNILLYFAGSTALAFIQKWQLTEKEKAEIEKENTTSELAYLRQQINPHFLFNSLNNIYSLAYRKSDATTDAILKLSAILRYMLYDADKQEVNLDKEIENIENYLKLQELRLTDKTSVNFNITGNPQSHRIPPLLLIPLVENAFKYGSDNINKSFITIDLEITDKGFTFVVKNKIVIKTENKKDENSGIGLKNIKRRLALIYPDNHSLEITNENDIFVVKLEIDDNIF